MEQDELISFVRANGYPKFTARQLKRFREEKLVDVRVEHPGFGGTATFYTAEAAQRVLDVCRLLQEYRDFNVVRFRLWLKGQTIEIGLLKESIWSLTPFSTWKEPTTDHERRVLAQKMARKIFNATWKSVRTNFGRKVLQNFEHSEDQRWFLNLETKLLYGVPVDFSRDFLSDYGSSTLLEEPADILSHGLQTKYIRSVPPDIAEGLQDISSRQLLSWTKYKAVLFAATTEEMALARERQKILGHMFECLEIMGYTSKLHRLVRILMKRPTLQALLICAALTMEQNGFGPNLEAISIAVSTSLPIFNRMQAVREALQRELPAIAMEIPSLPDLGKLLVHGTQKERDSYFIHLQEVYHQNKDVLDAFWARHPSLKED